MQASMKFVTMFEVCNFKLMNKHNTLLYSLLLFATCLSCNPQTTTLDQTYQVAYQSPLGKTFNLPEPSEKQLDDYEKALTDYKKDSTNTDNIIWLGRRLAYMGRYEEAIVVYTKGIMKDHNEARFYRHRGHRYISQRKFIEAINDFGIAAELTKGKPNRIEQDGMPNAQNIPISTLQGNIWYHLGLAYYLNHEYEKAFESFLHCRNIGNNDDNIVSSTHWLYMIQRRLGNLDKANEMLEPIHDKMTIIENHSYYDLCKLYKNLIQRKALQPKDGTSAGDAVLYGLANWEFYNNRKEEAQKAYETLLENGSWNSFGYIAAEADYLKYFR